MYALWVVGSFLENLLGRWRFSTLYLLSAVGGSVAVLAVADAQTGVIETVDDLMRWRTETAGASGAVFGLFGAILWVTRRLGADIRGILGVIGFNVVFSFVFSGVSWQGHLGGLVVGLALGAAFAFAPPRRQHPWAVGWSITAAAVLVGLALIEAARIPQEATQVVQMLLSGEFG
jgi:membrane associated rhomboid family serine protease